MSIQYAFSDVHGRLDLLEAALSLVDLAGHAGHSLFALGDYIDGGPDSAGVLYVLKSVAEQYPDQAVVILGNHEIDVLDWLDADDEDFDWLAADVGLGTTRSFLGDETVARVLEDLDGDVTDPDVFARLNATVKREIKVKHAGLISWLRARPLVWETEELILVHAGIDEDGGAESWRLLTDDYTLTHKHPPTFGPTFKRIVAGHTSTEPMHGDGGHGIFIDPGHVYLDGDVLKNGVLNVLCFDTNTDEYTHLSVP